MAHFQITVVSCLSGARTQSNELALVVKLPAWHFLSKDSGQTGKLGQGQACCDTTEIRRTEEWSPFDVKTKDWKHP